MHRNLSLTALCLAAGLGVGAGDVPLLLRNPTLSKSHVVFAYAEDLWIVPRTGGEARRITSGLGTEGQPWFSPDGSMIAFTADYDGNTDVYVVPASGGVPRRMTYHPGTDFAMGWTPDGKSVVFASGRTSATGRTQQLFTLSLDGAFPEVLPLPSAHEGAISPDGKRVAYVPHRRAFQAWKRYRGGTATPIWIADLKDSRVVKVPRTDSNDFCPVWLGGKLYFLSDRKGPFTLYSYDPGTQAVEQLLDNKGLDLKAMSAGPDALVYEQFGAIHLFDPATRKATRVEITLHGDLPGLRPRFEKVGPVLTNPGISPTGARAVFEARGEILTVPAEKGTPRNLTATPGVAERDPAWSPDGKRIAYFSDASGEYALHVKDQDGLGDPQKFVLEPSFYYNPVWSPDSKKIAFSDKRLNLWLLDVEKGKPQKIDTLIRGGGGIGVSWSPDSRWIAYAKPLPSYYGAAYVYAVDQGKVFQLTDGMSDVAHPTFDRTGKHLLFTASTNIGPAVSGFDMNAYPHRPTRSLYLAVLKQGDPSPLAPESDEEKDADAKKDGAKKEDAKKGPGEKKPPEPTVIDLEGLSQRIVAMPITDKGIQWIDVTKDNAILVLEFSGGRGDGPAVGGTLHKFDMEKRKLDKVMDDVRNIAVSANGAKMLVRQGEAWIICDAGQAPKPAEGKLKTELAEVRVEPMSEWQQMYRETWRVERDFFYDPGHHGLDLKAAEKKYAPYLAGLGHRSDLNYLFDEMLGELSVGHLYVRGGDAPNPKRIPGGLLGADFTVERGRYRFAKIYNGENWNPQLRAPLTQPGAEVKQGEFLLAVNGLDLTSKQSPYQLLENTAGQQVVLKVGPEPDGKGARSVTVVPVPNESALRNLDWIEHNRRKVAQLSGGRLAYVWLPDTANGGYTHFNRYWFAQLDKDGAVIDERFNGGGSAADYIIDYLKKPVNSYWAVREGDDFRQPFGTMAGAKVMLINENAGSGGDYMPWLFKRAGLGPLIGKRTWGGLVGIGGYPTLVDGGTITAPHFAFYSPEGRFGIENEGVAPDIDVDLDPQAWREGRDTQLEKAVNVLMEALKKQPPVKVKRPPYPNYHK